MSQNRNYSSSSGGTARQKSNNREDAQVGGASISEEAPVFSHLPVMLHECIDGLNTKPDGIYIDGTAGGGGHSFEIAKRLTSGRLISIDRDRDAIKACKERLNQFGERVTLIHDNYRNLSVILASLGIEKIDGALFDLGISSYQIDTPERGFSYSRKGDFPLDMRMSQDDSRTAYDVVNGYPAEELRRIIFEYGEEKFAGRIVERILEARAVSPISTTGELSELIKNAIPARAVEHGSHPAKRTFQAIRIEVNGELDGIEPALNAACEALNPGGRIAVMTFHSLEDRIVKNVFSKMAKGCTCPPDFPVCVCGKKPYLKIINKKPIEAGADELSVNSRAKSAKLRIAEKLPTP